MTSPEAPPSLRARPSLGREPADGVPDNLLRHYAGVLRRRFRWVALGIVLGLAAGYVSTLFVTPVSTTHYYKATNTVVINGSTSDNSPNYSLQQAALLVHSQTLLTQVAKKLGLTPVDVSKHLGAYVRSNGIALDITGVSTNPLQATALADSAASFLNPTAVAAAKKQLDSQRANLNGQLQSLQGQEASLQSQINRGTGNTDALQQQLQSVQDSANRVASQLTQLATTPPFSLSTLTPAHPIEINEKGYGLWLQANQNTAGQLPTNSQGQLPSGFDDTDLSKPALQSKPTRMAIGGAAGLVLGLLSAFLVEAWDDRIRRRDRVEALTGLPVLAEIPRLTRREQRHRELALVDLENGLAAERYRAARTSVLFALEATVGTRAAARNGSYDDPAGDRFVDRAGGRDDRRRADDLGRSRGRAEAARTVPASDEAGAPGQADGGRGGTAGRPEDGGAAGRRLTGDDAGRRAPDGADDTDDPELPGGPLLLITSPSPGEGKSTTTVNLASACADSGIRVLVVDGDIHRPTIDRYLEPEIDPDHPTLPAPTRVDGVWFLPGPRLPSSPGETMTQLRRLLGKWRDYFDLVVLDTPPMLTTNDANDLLADADGVVLVLRVGQTRRGPAERAAEVLGRFGAPALGIILNACERNEMDQYYSYGYGYGYGYGTSRRARNAARKDGRRSRDDPGRGRSERARGRGVSDARSSAGRDPGAPGRSDPGAPGRDRRGGPARFWENDDRLADDRDADAGSRGADAGSRGADAGSRGADAGSRGADAAGWGTDADAWDAHVGDREIGDLAGRVGRDGAGQRWAEQDRDDERWDARRRDAEVDGAATRGEDLRGTPARGEGRQQRAGSRQALFTNGAAPVAGPTPARGPAQARGATPHGRRGHAATGFAVTVSLDDTEPDNAERGVAERGDAGPVDAKPDETGRPVVDLDGTGPAHTDPNDGGAAIADPNEMDPAEGDVDDVSWYPSREATPARPSDDDPAPSDDGPAPSWEEPTLFFWEESGVDNGPGDWADLAHEFREAGELPDLASLASPPPEAEEGTADDPSLTTGPATTRPAPTEGATSRPRRTSRATPDATTPPSPGDASRRSRATTTGPRAAGSGPVASRRSGSAQATPEADTAESDRGSADGAAPGSAEPAERRKRAFRRRR